MAKPATTSRTIPKGTQLTISVTGQTGNGVCAAGALEAGDYTAWTPQMLQSGVRYKPKASCTVEFLVDFLGKPSPDLTVTVAGGPKPDKVWIVKRSDGPRQSWQLWVVVKKEES
jgi:hypothetical protein